MTSCVQGVAGEPVTIIINLNFNERHNVKSFKRQLSDKKVQLCFTFSTNLLCFYFAMFRAKDVSHLQEVRLSNSLS